MARPRRLRARPKGPRVRAPVAVAFVVLGSWGARASADGPAPEPAPPPAGRPVVADTPRYQLDYEAEGTCPDRSAFAAKLRSRAPRPVLVERMEDGDAVATLRVRIAARDGASRGELELRDAEGTEERRAATSRTCEEVANALALIAAVLLDPDAPEAPTSAVDAASPPASAPAPPAPVRPDASAPRPHAPSNEGRPSIRAKAGVELGILGGIGPAVAPMGGVFVDLGIPSRLVGFPWSVRLGADVAKTSSDLRGGSQIYEWAAAAARLCVAPLSLPGRLRLAPCGGFQVGGHRGTTQDVRSPSSSLDLWLAPVAGGSLEWRWSSVVSLELMGGAAFPLRRSRFFLAPNTTIYEIPSVAGTAALGVQVRFL